MKDKTIDTLATILTSLFILSVVFGAAFGLYKLKTYMDQYLPVGGYSITIIDGCEYIETQGPYKTKSLAHKGNCKNKIHQTLK